jgi:hypothetical protein
MPQFLMGMVHFFDTSLKARYTDLITASSLGKDSLFLVYFLILPLRFSIRLVGVDDLADFQREIKEYGQFLPVIFPALDSVGILTVPLFLKSIQCCLGCLTGRCGIDILHIVGKLPFIFPYYVPAAIAYLVNYTNLSGRLREDRPDCLRLSVASD